MAKANTQGNSNRLAKAAADTAKASALLAGASLETPPKDPSPLSGVEFDSWKRLQANCGAGEEGFYIKVYKEIDPEQIGRFGRRKFLFPIDNPLTIDDFECFLQSTVNEPGTGRFTGQLHRHGDSGARGTITVTVDIPVRAAAKAAGGGTDVAAALAPFLESLRVTKTVKELMGGGDAGPSAELVNSLSRSLETGLTVGQKAASGGNSLIQSLLEKLLTPKESMVERLAMKWLEANMGKLNTMDGADKADIVEQFNKVTDLMDRLRPLLGNAPRREPGFLEVLAPYLPAIVQPLTSAWNLWQQTRQMEITAANPGLRGLPEPSKGVMPAMPSPLDEIATAIRMGDTSKFPVIEQMILSMGPGGQQLLANIQSGQMTAEKLQELLISVSFPGVREHGAVVFIGRFIAWVREKSGAVMQPTVESPLDGQPPFPVKAKGHCKGCGAEYSYPELDAYRPEERCDAQRDGGAFCGGEITLDGQPT